MRFRFGLAVLLLVAQALGAANPATAQNRPTALASALPESAISATPGGFRLDLALTQAVPYRIFYLTAPDRIVIDFNQVNFAGLDRAALMNAAAIADIAFGNFRPGWSRLILTLDAPGLLDQAALRTEPDQSAVLALDFRSVGPADFAERAGAPEDALFDLSLMPPPDTPLPRRDPDAPLRVMLDPGHGGIDPGAERGDDIEASLMLKFALELQEILLRSGNFEVALTRQEDVFVPLEARITAAHRTGADVFLSLHADVVTEGQASGATIYTLADEASDTASAKLAERHNRQDLLTGVDLTAQDDVVANVLMDLARTDTAHRTDRLADALVDGLDDKVRLYKHPRLSAGFSVLKSPDIPSVLIELGFMSSPRDLENLRNPAWRLKAGEAIRDGLVAWAAADAAEAALRRQ